MVTVKPEHITHARNLSTDIAKSCCLPPLTFDEFCYKHKEAYMMAVERFPHKQLELEEAYDHVDLQELYCCYGVEDEIVNEHDETKQLRTLR